MYVCNLGTCVGGKGSDRLGTTHKEAHHELFFFGFIFGRTLGRSNTVTWRKVSVFIPVCVAYFIPIKVPLV